MMCEEPAAAEPAPVVEAATPEPPPMTPDLPKEEGIDFSRTHRPCDRRYSITISLLAVFALVKVLSAVGILDVD